MQKGLKILVVFFLVFAVFFTMSIRDAEAATCYKYYWSEDWSYWYMGYLVLWSDYTFEYVDDYGYYYDGEWGKWGTTYYFDWNDDCYSFGSGTLAKGFEKCQDGYDIGYLPKLFQLKKTNCKYVPYSNAAKTNGSDKKGPFKKALRPTIDNN
jgi:hypothetical protein